MPGIILLELEDSLNGSISGEVHPTSDIPRMMKNGCNKFQSEVEGQREAVGEEGVPSSLRSKGRSS